MRRKRVDSMKRLVLQPIGWKCTLNECPPGLFVFDESVGFKSEYRTNDGNLEAFCKNGEYFWGGASTQEQRGKNIVQPVNAVWEDCD